jgi:hypothetical protein
MREKLQISLQKSENKGDSPDMFYKSHMSGFGGIKQKYLADKTVNFDKRELEKHEKEEVSYS